MNVALERYSELARHLKLGSSRKSAKQLVRLLDNTHDEHIRELVEYIETHIPSSGPIGERLIAQTDPFQFHQALAEFHLLSHLRAREGRSSRGVTAVYDRASYDTEKRRGLLRWGSALERIVADQDYDVEDRSLLRKEHLLHWRRSERVAAGRSSSKLARS